jgi:adenine deaminase
METQSARGHIIDIFNQRIFPGEIQWKNGKITSILEVQDEVPPSYLMPGFIDAHVHVESSMLLPTNFARMAVVHGTVGTVSDPHEIANVLGEKGVLFMLENAAQTPFKFAFGVPSCVPATSFETAGAILDDQAVLDLLKRPDMYYLAEMMNFPGVLYKDDQVMAKIQHAKDLQKPIDGHAPGLRGNEAATYIQAGISTDHECFTLPEAQEKQALGMKILVREGSAARNLEALWPLFQENGPLMLCTDDQHPDLLLTGHINRLVARLVEKKLPLFHILKAACIEPVLHYNMPIGLLRVGDSADFIRIKDLKHFECLTTYIQGDIVAENGKSLLPYLPSPAPNQFNIGPKKPEDFRLTIQDKTPIRVIEALDGELITRELAAPAFAPKGYLEADVANDNLLITVVNRYKEATPAMAWIKNFGLKSGAIAASVAHDSHNVVAVGTSTEALCEAVNAVIAHQGGLAVYTGLTTEVLPLPVAGLMTTADGPETAEAYTRLDAMAKTLGTPLRAPFMSLSFMALLVIPQLKLSDLGLFDGHQFRFCGLPLDATEK